MSVWFSYWLIPSNKQDLADNQTWRIIIVMPAIIGSVALLLSVFIIRYDGPMFYIHKGDRNMARKSILVLYNLRSQFHGERVY